jgi:hypothetical protein
MYSFSYNSRMSIWTFVHILACATCAQNLSKLFNYNPLTDSGVKFTPPKNKCPVTFPPPLLELQPQFGPWPTFMKQSVSHQFTRSKTFGRTPWAGDSSSQGLYLYTNTEKRTHTQTLNIHDLSGIRTHDPGFRASEDSVCLRPFYYRDRRPVALVF